MLICIIKIISSISLHSLAHFEAFHDFRVPSIKQINSLIQFDPEPNFAIKEVKVELYKISISFSGGGNII